MNLSASTSSLQRRSLLQLVAVVALLAVFLATMSAREAMEGNALQKAFLIGRMAVLVLLCTFFLRRDGQTWRELGLRRPRRWWIAPLLVCAGFVAILLLTTLIRSALFPLLGIAAPRLASAQLMPGDLGQYLFAVTVAWTSAAFGEELLLRGFILDRIVRVTGGETLPRTVAAIVLQGFLFGSFHSYQGIGGVLITATIGIVMGFLWLLSGRNLWASILLHGIINFVTATEAFTARPH